MKREPACFLAVNCFLAAVNVVGSVSVVRLLTIINKKAAPPVKGEAALSRVLEPINRNAFGLLGVWPQRRVRMKITTWRTKKPREFVRSLKYASNCCKSELMLNKWMLP